MKYISVMTAFMALAAVFAGQAQAAPIGAKAIFVTGEANYVAVWDKKKYPVKVNTPFNAGDRVFTGAGGRVEIEFQTGALLLLDGGTDVTIKLLGLNGKGAFSAVFDIAVGRIKSSFSKIRADDSAEYHTKAAIIGLAGTPEHVIEAGETGGAYSAKIYLLGAKGDKGALFVQGFDAAKARVLLRPGTATTVLRGKPPAKPFALPPDVRKELNKFRFRKKLKRSVIDRSVEDLRASEGKTADLGEQGVEAGDQTKTTMADDGLIEQEDWTAAARDATTGERAVADVAADQVAAAEIVDQGMAVDQNIAASRDQHVKSETAAAGQRASDAIVADAVAGGLTSGVSAGVDAGAAVIGGAAGQQVSQDAGIAPDTHTSGGTGATPNVSVVTEDTTADASSSGGQSSAPQDKVIDISSKVPQGGKIVKIRVSINWDARSIPDQFQIIYEGNTIFDSGQVRHTGSKSVVVNGSSPQITIRVLASNKGTAWNWSAQTKFAVIKPQ